MRRNPLVGCHPKSCSGNAEDARFTKEAQHVVFIRATRRKRDRRECIERCTGDHAVDARDRVESLGRQRTALFQRLPKHRLVRPVTRECRRYCILHRTRTAQAPVRQFQRGVENAIEAGGCDQGPSIPFAILVRDMPSTGSTEK